jgi:hypothetical protein
VPPTQKPRPGTPTKPYRGGAPANDNCANAIAVTPATIPFTDSQNTAGATDEAGEPASACTVQGNSVWYTFANDTANSFVVDVSLCGSDFDTALMVYQVDPAQPCAFASFVPVACNDDSDCGDGLQSQVQFEAVAGGVYKIQAGGFDAETGNLTVSITGEELVCPSTVVNGTLGSGSPDWPSTSGMQTPARIFRDGTPSTCDAPKSCPGTFGSGSFAFDAYTFSNDSGEDQCVTVLFDPDLGAGGNERGGTACAANVHAIAYLGAYDPTNLCLNYLADVGSSSTQPFSFTVPAGMDFVIAIVANNPGGVGLGCSYRFTVRGNICGCTLTCPANVTVPNDPGQCGAVVNYPPPTATGNCDTIACTPPSGSVFPVGTTTVTCSNGAGARGGGGDCSFTVTVNDTQAPTVACPTVAPLPSDPGQCGAVVAYPAPTVVDACPGAVVTCAPASGSFFPVGTTAVACTATDAAGNTAACSFAVTVVDMQAPSVACPADVAVVGTPGPTGTLEAVVTYPAPTATDACPGVTVGCVPASGSTFAEGTTVVTCTATDAAGNVSTCTFAVVVTDEFNVCLVDSGTGDTFGMVTDPTSASYGFWRYTVAATGEVFSGFAESVNSRPRRLTAYDRDDPESTMEVQATFGPRGTGTVTVVDRASMRRFVLRDLNTSDGGACP